MAMLNALTVDVEDYYHVQAFADVIDTSRWEEYPSRVEENTMRFLDLFAAHRICATFFVLGWVAQRCPRLIGRIVAGGHQIGCHSYNHRLIYSSTAEDFREDLRRAKKTIEDITGIAVISFRAPSYSITAQTPWALEVLGEEGFEYDSSIFPVIHDNYGIRNAPRFPHIRTLTCGRQIREFPPSTLRVFGGNIPVAGGGYFRLFPYSFTSWAIRHLNQVERQPAMVYLHPWELDPDQPRISASWLSKFRHYQNLHSTETKCQKLLTEYAWAPMEEVFCRAALLSLNTEGLLSC
jgi:polysaccharide deacetylase family protein (PEP-CTERM system associated)